MRARPPAPAGIDRRTPGRDRSHVRAGDGRGGRAAWHLDANPSATPDRAATAASPGRRSDAPTTPSPDDGMERARDGLPGSSRLVRPDFGLCAIPAYGLGTGASVPACGSDPVAQALGSVGLGWSQKLGRYTDESQSIPVRCAHGQRPPRPRDTRVLSMQAAQLHNREEPAQQSGPHRAPEVLPVVRRPHRSQGDPLARTFLEYAGRSCGACPAPADQSAQA
jgi:hypothetical protein